MFNFSPDKPRIADHNTDSYGFSNQPWSRCHDNTVPNTSSAFSGHQTYDGKQSFSNLKDMDWAPVSFDAQANDQFHQQENQGYHQHVAMELEDLGSPQNGGGVGRLVAHFENKEFRAFGGKLLAPASPLHSRVLNQAFEVNSSCDQNQSQAAASSADSINTVKSNFGFGSSSYLGSRPITTAAAPTCRSSKIASPVASAGESWGDFASLQRGTSPATMSTSIPSFGGMQDIKGAGSVAGSSSGPFESFDEFMSAHRMQSPMAHSPFHRSQISSSPMMTSPMASTPIHQSTPVIGGTPGFEIWRPPDSSSGNARSTKLLPNHFAVGSSGPNKGSFKLRDNGFSNNLTGHRVTSASSDSNQRSPPNRAGLPKPPVPTTPKPDLSFHSQYMMRANSPAKTKERAKLATSRAQSSGSQRLVSDVKREPATPQALETMPSLSKSAPFFSLPSSRNVKSQIGFGLEQGMDRQSQNERPRSVSLRGQVGTRPSREQVPAEAWEYYKETIRELYLEERKPLKEVMIIMADKYSFQATPKMYKTRFSQWGFVKNNTEEEVKKLLSMKFQRDAEGKVSEFVRNGRVVNLGTYLKRKGVTEYDLVDFELPADLPAHVRCRTPTPPPVPGFLRSPDLLRAQELVINNVRKAFLHCRQFEAETHANTSWPITMVWGAGSSDLLLEANFYFEAGDADQGGVSLMKAFKQLELDLRKLSALGILELLLGMVNRDPGVMMALCKYLAAYSTTNFERSQPLRQIFTCLYEVQQRHGSTTLSQLLWGSVPTVAEELEAIYSRQHPYVARTWIDLALFYEQVNVKRLEDLASELRSQLRQVEQRLGLKSTDALSLRYSILQLLYAADPRSEATRQATNRLWSHLKSMGVVFEVRDSKPNVYCYHSPVKVEPWTKRCRRLYDSGVSMLAEHVGVRVQPYFEEDFHHTVHVADSQEAWSSALDHMGSTKYAFI